MTPVRAFIAVSVGMYIPAFGALFAISAYGGAPLLPMLFTYMVVTTVGSYATIWVRYS